MRKNNIMKKMNQARPALADVNLSDRFLFSQVMQDESLAAELLRTLLPNLKIRRAKLIESEKTIEHSYLGKGIRLDIYLLEEMNGIFNLEMQNDNVDFLPKRCRFYHSSSDVNRLKRGQHFQELPESYVIFICTFDLFHEGRCVYSFQNRCDEDHNLLLNDGTYKIFINCKAWRSASSRALKGLLRYFEQSSASVADEYDSPFMSRLHQKVCEIKGDEKMSMAYTVWKLNQDDARLEGERIGEKRGEKRGEKNGEKRLAQLVQHLVRESRSEDLARAMADQAYRKALYKEYGIH